MNIAIKKLKKNKKSLLVGAFIASLLFAALWLASYSGEKVQERTLRAIPGIAKIYDAEHEHFPKHAIGAEKHDSLTSDGAAPTASYSIVLTSQSLLSFDEIRVAGKLACETGLPRSTVVKATSRAQLSITPFYAYKSLTGQCP